MVLRQRVERERGQGIDLSRGEPGRLGELYHRTDKREEAQEHLATATTMYREMGMTYWLQKAEAEMKELG